MFEVRLRFDPALQQLLHTADRIQPAVRRLHEKTSVKDVIESCGVPHPEVDLIVDHGEPVDFSHQISGETEITILPFGASPSVFREHRLQQAESDRFVADGHLGTLTRNLRLLGIDVAYDATADDAALLRIMADEDRALLTGDRRLLMHRIVRTGYSPRSDDPEEQTAEVIRRFNLLPRLLAPYTRCLRCNGLLQAADKEKILDRLEPLTRRYYHDFRQCAECGQIYWSGSHAGRLEALIHRVSAAKAAL